MPSLYCKSLRYLNAHFEIETTAVATNSIAVSVTDNSSLYPKAGNLTLSHYLLSAALSCCPLCSGHQFPSAPPTSFTAAAGYSTEDAPQLSQLPNSCLAAVAQPNTVAALLVLSKAAYMEVSSKCYCNHTTLAASPAVLSTTIWQVWWLHSELHERDLQVHAAHWTS